MATEHLGGRGVEVYLPRVLEPRSHLRAPRMPVPLFPSYVFARAVVYDWFTRLQFCPGVAGLVRFGDLVAALDDEIVEALRGREGERGFVVFGAARRALDRRALDRGTRVRICSGPLAGLAGVVNRPLSANTRVQILLELARGNRRVEVDVHDVVCA